MKKILGIILLSFLYFNSAFAYMPIWQDPVPSSIEKRQIIIILSVKNNETIDGVIQKDGYGTTAKYFKCPSGVKKTRMNPVPQYIKEYVGEPHKWLSKQFYPLSVWKLTCKVANGSGIEMETMINKAKNTCKSLGFKDGTEKFADCSLKLYSQSVELAAEQNKTIVMQPQSSGSNVITIYDPVRDSNALMNKGMKMLSGGCTLGVDC